MKLRNINVSLAALERSLMEKRAMTVVELRVQLAERDREILSLRKAVERLIGKLAATNHHRKGVSRRASTAN